MRLPRHRIFQECAGMIIFTRRYSRPRSDLNWRIFLTDPQPIDNPNQVASPVY